MLNCVCIDQVGFGMTCCVCLMKTWAVFNSVLFTWRWETRVMAYKVDSLQEANDALKGYGPESFRITLKKKAGQESAVSKHINIHVSSMSGKFI